MTSNYQHTFGQVSGLILDEASAIALRWLEDAPFTLSTGESHVFEIRGDDAALDIPASPGRFSGIWRAASGDVYVTHQGGVILSQRLGQPDWDLFHFNGVFSGIWGLDGSDLVFAWGREPGGRPVMMQKSKSGTWVDINAPAEPVLGMHGTQPGLIFAVGAGGSISQWDNGTWRSIASPVEGALSSVFVVDQDEIYACGTGCDYILEGSIYGWARRGPFDYPLHCVAKKFGHLWVGCGLSGLRRLNPGEAELEAVRPQVVSYHMDARQELLVSGGDGIVGTKNGINFTTQPIGPYVSLADPHPPTWLP